MKLQISYNFTQLTKALEVAKSTAVYADIIEIGSSLLFAEGLKVIRAFKDQFPNKPICVDTKMIESAQEIIKLGVMQGATYFTLLAGAAHHVIQNSTSTAHSQRAMIMLDLIDAPSTGQSAMDAATLEVDYLLFHRTAPALGIAELHEEWMNVKGNTSIPIFVAGKIDRSSLIHYYNLKPAGMIVSNAITHAENPEAEAQYFKSIINP